MQLIDQISGQGADLVAVFMFFLAAAAAPGPVNILMATVGASVGPQQCVKLIFGASLGLVVVMSIAVLGAAAATQLHPVFRSVLNAVAFLYLIHFAIRILRFAYEADSRHLVAPNWVDMVVIQCVNPKAWILMGAFAINFFPDGYKAFHMVFAVIICIVTAAASMVVYAFAGSGLTIFFCSRPAKRVLSFVASGLIILSLGLALFS